MSMTIVEAAKQHNIKRNTINYLVKDFTVETNLDDRGVRLGNVEPVPLSAGLPEGLAALLSESDTGASKGGLFDDSRQLSRLVGWLSTPLAATVAKTLQADTM